MWDKIRDFIFIKEDKTLIKIELADWVVSNQELVTAALDHYCETCKRGFKTKGARNAHNALKHKND